MTETKNRTMRLGVIMAVIALITLIGLAGTFAKYVSTGEGQDQARVAKWGVEVTATSDAFSQYYACGTHQDTSTGADVASGDTDKVVAPGTNGTLLTTALKGTPEVQTTVTIGAGESGKIVSLEAWDNYCPIIFTIDNVVYKQEELGADKVTDLETRVNNALEEFSGTYAPNTDLSTIGSHTATWEWQFDRSDSPIQADALDTSLGDAAATGSANAAKIGIDLKVTVEQSNKCA